MPFKQTHVMDERLRFVDEARRSLRSFSELCRRYDISRKTGHKWLARFEQGGFDALADQARAPHTCPWSTPLEVREVILQVRKAFPDYGAKKIRWYLEANQPELPLPSRTTIHKIIDQEGLVQPRRKRVRRWHPGRPQTFASEPNQTWTIDFKGQFRLGNRALCYPLTVQDMHSRFLLDCRGLPAPKLLPTRKVLERLFREFGLPQRVRSDNGTPFASNALGRLSQLSVWFVRLGIAPEFIEPASPGQNGKHENMHGHLKRRTARRPRASFPAQQRAFDAFRAEYNDIRPHESLDGRVPSSLYSPSPRPFPKRLPPLTYPPHFDVRLVSHNGGIRWFQHRIGVSQLLAEQHIGLEFLEAGLFDVYFGPIWLGRFHEAKRRIIDRIDPPEKQTIQKTRNYTEH